MGRWKYDEEVNPYNTPKGMMFDLEAVNDVTVYGVDLGVYFPESVGVVEVYITTLSNSTFVGNEEDPTKWTKIHNSSVTWKYNVVGAKVPLQTPFRMKANTKRGVYVTFTDNLALVTSPSLGSEIGNVVAETDDLKLLEGTMNSYPFGKFPIGPKIFFGRMRYFVTHSCSSAAECDDNIDGTEDACIQGQCQNNPIPGVCGNGVCEVSSHNEYCSTCPGDCEGAANVCGTLDSIVVSNSIGYGGATGIVFATKAVTDLTIYEIHAAVYPSSSTQYTVNLYSKMGTFNGDSSLDSWDLVFSGPLEQVCTSGRFCDTAVLKIPLSSTNPVSTPAGRDRSFYFNLSSRFLTYRGDGSTIVSQNNELQVFAGTTVNGGLGSVHENDMKFSALFKYDNGLVKRSCSSSSDCDDNNIGTEDKCVGGLCQNNPIPGICGNGICENHANEYCSTCPKDCGAPDYCDRLVKDDGGSGMVSSSNMRGIAFDIEAVRSISIYEISFYIGSRGFTNNVGAKVYTKEGLYKDSSDLNEWTLVFNSVVEVKNSMIVLPFSITSPITTAPRAKRSYYVTISDASRMKHYGGQQEGSIVGENSDMKVFAGEAYNTNFQTPVATDFRALRGTIKYDFTNMEAPSSSPTMVSSPPTVIDIPTSSPSKAPVVGDPKPNGDSPFRLKITRKGVEKWRHCSWTAENPSRRCGTGAEYDRMSSHCPVTCSASIACVDSKASFDIGNQNIMTCNTVSQKIVSPCAVAGIPDTCRALCPRDLDKVKFFAGLSAGGTAKRRNCTWLKSKNARRQNEMCGLAGDKGYPSASEVCVSICNSCVSVPKISNAPSTSPSESPQQNCGADSKSKQFLLEGETPPILKKCRWLQRFKIKAATNSQKRGRLWRICGSTSQDETYGAAGDVCPYTCEHQKLFYRTTNDRGIDIKKSCLWLLDAKRDSKRDRICSNSESASDGTKSAKHVCYIACNTCPQN